VAAVVVIIVIAINNITEIIILTLLFDSYLSRSLGKLLRVFGPVKSNIRRHVAILLLQQLMLLFYYCYKIKKNKNNYKKQ
jgi:hypothetical protein